MINKIAVITYLTITLNVNGLNVSIKRQMDKEVVHRHSGILFHHKKCLTLEKVMISMM